MTWGTRGDDVRGRRQRWAVPLKRRIERWQPDDGDGGADGAWLAPLPSHDVAGADALVLHPDSLRRSRIGGDRWWSRVAALFGETTGAAKLQGEELLVEPDLAAVLAFRVLG